MCYCLPVVVLGPAESPIHKLLGSLGQADNREGEDGFCE